MGDHFRRLASALVLMAAVAAPVGAQGQDAGAKLSPADARRLVSDAFSPDEKKAAAARDTLGRTREQDLKALWDALVAMPFRPPSKKPSKDRAIIENIEAPGAEMKASPVILRLPQPYDGKTPMPVVFRFHGSGDDATNFSQATDPQLEKVLLVTPQVPSKERQSWGEPGSRAYVDNVYHYLLRNYNVDADRVCLSGFSAGGAAAFFFAQTWPHRVSAFYAMGRVYPNFDPLPEACMDILSHTPGFFAVGLNDTAERVDGFRKAEAYYKTKSYPGVFNFVPGKEHTYLAELDPKGFEYILKAKRTRYPKDFNAVFFLYGNQQADEPFLTTCYWLEAKKYQQNGTPVRVTVQGNTIDIQGDKLSAGSVLLNDEIAKLDDPVVIKLNGKEVFNAKVERSVAFLLDWFDKGRDRGQLFWNRVDFGQ